MAIRDRQVRSDFAIFHFLNWHVILIYTNHVANSFLSLTSFKDLHTRVVVLEITYSFNDEWKNTYCFVLFFFFFHILLLYFSSFIFFFSFILFFHILFLSYFLLFSFLFLIYFLLSCSSFIFFFYILFLLFSSFIFFFPVLLLSYFLAPINCSNDTPSCSWVCNYCH